MFYSRYLKEDKRIQPSPRNRPPPSPRSAQSTQRRAPKANHATGRWGGLGLGNSKKHTNNAFDPLKYKDGKKTVHFSTIEVQHFHFDWNCVNDCFYTRKELTAMGSARFDDAATLRKERLLDVPSGNPNTASQDDLDMGVKNTPKSISALLELALWDKDNLNDETSIRGIEHFVYPELQQEMIRKKKEVQAQVMLFVRSKKPDPQGWRLANHSRMYSQWARDVAAEKGRAYRIHDIDDGMSRNSPTSSHSLRTLTQSASFSAASYYENELPSPLSVGSTGSVNQLQRRASDADASSVASSTRRGLLKNGGEGGNNLIAGANGNTSNLRFQELRVKNSDDHNEVTLKMTMSDDEPRTQSAGAGTDEA